MILCWHIVINVLLPTDLIMLFPQEVKGYNVTNVGTSIRCFHRKSSLANFVIMLETPVKKFTKATGQTVYRQIV